jgi:hypothetical protein
MTNITSSQLLGSTKSITVANGCVIAKDGPNMINKMGISDLDIPFDSVFTARQTLKTLITMPIMYGFLGTDITFLLLKPTYSSTTNTNVCELTSKYLEYYYETDPTKKYTFTDILVLSGNAYHRIPQIYIYNPNSYNVTIDIFAANLDDNIISDILCMDTTKIENLMYSSILTDMTLNSGSTQFEIYQADTLALVIPYNSINSINLCTTGITVYTSNNDIIELVFLNDFNKYQAMSRMTYLMANRNTTFATASSPALDTTAPILEFTGTTDTYVMSGTNITTSDILEYVKGQVSGLTYLDFDNDNILREYIDYNYITVNDVEMIIINAYTGEQIPSITADGKYYVTFIIKDVANNQNSYTKTILVDDEAPHIVFNSVTNTMSLTNDSQAVDPIITKDDIRRYYIDFVYDNVDGTMSNSGVTVTIEAPDTTILETIVQTSADAGGTYTITFSISDETGNITTEIAALSVIA